jgi:hypothetical protein
MPGSTFQWVAPEATVAYFTTEMDSITDGSFTAAGAAITNRTGSPALYPWIYMELVLASLTPAAGAFVDVWLLATLDGTNYSDVAKALQIEKAFHTFQLDTAAAAQRIVTKLPKMIPGLDFKFQLRNKAGVSWATGNTFKYARSYDQGITF